MSCTLARKVVVRSVKMEMSMPSGTQRLISGSSALMRSTVSITLASAFLVMVSRIAGWLLNIAAERELRVPCLTSATLDKRTTSPLTVLSMIFL